MVLDVLEENSSRHRAGQSGHGIRQTGWVGDDQNARERKRRLRVLHSRGKGQQKERDRKTALGRRSSTLQGDRKSTRLNSSHSQISYAVFCLKKKKKKQKMR